MGNSVDALCQKCGKPFRWFAVTPMICSKCKTEVSVYVGPNKSWHKEGCLRRALDVDNEELVCVEKNVPWGFWGGGTYNVYRCPECKAQKKVDN